MRKKGGEGRRGKGGTAGFFQRSDQGPGLLAARVSSQELRGRSAADGVAETCAIRAAEASARWELALEILAGAPRRDAARCGAMQRDTAASGGGGMAAREGRAERGGGGLWVSSRAWQRLGWFELGWLVGWLGLVWSGWVGFGWWVEPKSRGS